MVYTKKTHKFAILVDEYGRGKKQLQELVLLLKEDLSFLKQAPRVLASKRIQQARKGDYIVFGFSKRYDFRVLNKDQWEEYTVDRRTPVADLYEEWEEVEDLLDEYVEANYPNEVDVEDSYRPYCCNSDNVIILEDFDPDDIYYVEVPKKKKKKTTKKPTVKRRKVTTDTVGIKEAKIYHNFVKLGWDVFDIMLNEDEEEYVKINGNVYWIDRDNNGYGKLSVQ